MNQKKYSIEISGMHCTGCEMLIKMSLEEAGFREVAVSNQNKCATFSSHQNLKEVNELVESIFSVFEDYKYKNLVGV